MKSSNSSFRVKTLVMHFTAVNYEDSVKYLVNEGGGVSSHYLIPMLNDITYQKSSIEVLKLVDENERAWHAGVSHWQGRDGLNDTSIGIEIVNVPECIDQQVPVGFMKPRPVCIFPEFENTQIDLLIELSKSILKRNPDITPTAVVGHSDIAPSRKNDPGPRFPWQKLYEAGIGAWYENDVVAKYWNIFNQKSPSIGLVQKALATYGYKIAITGVYDRQTQDVLSAFQLHFVPWQVDGMANNQSIATLFALLEKYFSDNLTSLLENYEQENTFQAQTNFANQHDFNVDLSDKDNALLSKNKMVFLSNGIRSELTLSSYGIKSADIYINEQKINLGNYFSEANEKEKKVETFSIGKRTVQGRNSIRVDNVQLLPDFIPTIYPDAKVTEVDSEELKNVAMNNVQFESTDLNSENHALIIETSSDLEQLQSQPASLNIAISYPTLNKLDANLVKNKSGLQYDFKKLDDWLEKRLDSHITGAAVTVIHRGNLVKHDVYGFAQKYNGSGELLQKPIRMSKTTMFDLGENTQVLATSLAVMKLVDQGKLSLNKAVTHYLDEYRGSNREIVTVSDLLSHSSGYKHAVDFYDLNNPFGEYLYSTDAELTKQYLLTKVPFSNDRGQQVYSEINYMLLGLLIERVTGMDLDEYLETQIYQPLGLTKTLFNPLEKGHDSDEFVSIYHPVCDPKETALLNNVHACVVNGQAMDSNTLYSMQGVSGHSGVFSSSDDLAVLAQLLLNGGGYHNQHLFTQPTLDRFTQSVNPYGEIGLGWKLGKFNRASLFGPYASSSAYGHSSKTGSTIIVDPVLELAIITYINEQPSFMTDHEAKSLQQFNPTQIKLSSIIYESIFEAQKHAH